VRRSPSDANLELCLSAPCLRGLRDRLLRAIVENQPPATADLELAQRSCRALDTIPLYSRGVRIERLKLEIATLLTAQ